MRTSVRHANATSPRLAAALLASVAALSSNLPAALAAESAVSTTREVQSDKVLLHDPARYQFERLNERDIKRHYRACASEAVKRRIGSSEIAACSIAYDVLLTRHFGGDFLALLTWSRAQRGEPLD